MEKTNVLFLLTPKTQLACLKDSMNVRQALEKMRAHGFTAIPLISEEGEYLGKTKITSLLRKNRFPAVKVDAEIGELVNLIINQNFVPVVDDRNVLMGIVTRRRVMQELFKN